MSVGGVDVDCVSVMVCMSVDVISDDGSMPSHSSVRTSMVGRCEWLVDVNGRSM